MAGGRSDILGVGGPVSRVDLTEAAHEKLQFLLVKHVHEASGDNVVKPALERLALLANAIEQSVLNDELDILALVCVGDGYASSPRLELNRRDLAKAEHLVGKGVVDDASNLVL